MRGTRGAGSLVESGCPACEAGTKAFYAQHWPCGWGRCTAAPPHVEEEGFWGSASGFRLPVLHLCLLAVKALSLNRGSAIAWTAMYTTLVDGYGLLRAESSGVAWEGLWYERRSPTAQHRVFGRICSLHCQLVTDAGYGDRLLFSRPMWGQCAGRSGPVADVFGVVESLPSGLTLLFPAP